MGAGEADSAPNASHHVDYAWDNPSPVFTEEQVRYVEAISAYLTPDELSTAKQVEWMEYNRNVDACGYSFVPGLRGDVSIAGNARGAVYVRRFSSASYGKMMDLFLHHETEDFPKSGSGGNMPGYRMTLPDGGQFYPVEFFGDLEAWRKRLRESAELHGTLLAHFDRGTFVVSDGQRFAFGDLKIELLRSRRHPKSW